MKNLLQKFLALALALALGLGAVPALAAEVSATASTVQLSKTEGPVTVTNSGGRALTQLADMRLYSGNHVATEAEGYAWLTLDSTKLNKLDALSEVELRKKDRKLELLLDKGNLYFNVTKPLEDQETLNIRTSTMVVGIRGTSGWVKVVDERNTLVYILEGTVWCTVTDPLSGQSKTTALSGGETARFMVHSPSEDGDRCDIILERFTEADIDGFVLAELLGDEPMCEKIYAGSGLDLRNLTEDAARERLERDQAEAAEKLREQEELAAGQDRNISRDPVWASAETPETAPRTSESGSTSSGSAGGGGSTAPSGIVRLTMPVTDMEVQQALNLPTTRQVIVSPGPDPARNTLDIGISMDVAAGKTLTLEDGVPAEVRGGLNVDGTADLRDRLDNVAGTVTVNSANTLRVGGGFTNRSALRVTASGRAIVEGTLSNTGTIALTQGARVLARGFALTAGVPGWSVSDAADEAGYYSLVYTGTVEGPSEPGDTDPDEPEPDTPDPSVDTGAFRVTGGSAGTDYTYDQDDSGYYTLTIKTSTPLTISMAEGAAQSTDAGIAVAGGAGANITLDGVKVDLSGGGSAAFDAGSGNVTLTLANGSENTLQSPSGFAGLQKTGIGTLTIQGDGELRAAGGAGGAGIGGGDHESSGNITIIGSTVTAAGSEGGAGIGGGSYGDCGDVLIDGGADITVISTGGAGIGSGFMCDLSEDSVFAIKGASIFRPQSNDVEVNGRTAPGAGIGSGVNVHTFEDGSSYVSSTGYSGDSDDWEYISCSIDSSGVCTYIQVHGIATITKPLEIGNAELFPGVNEGSIIVDCLRGKTQDLITKNGVLVNLETEVGTILTRTSLAGAGVSAVYEYNEEDGYYYLYYIAYGA